VGKLESYLELGERRHIDYHLKGLRSRFSHGRKGQDIPAAGSNGKTVVGGGKGYGNKAWANSKLPRWRTRWVGVKRLTRGRDFPRPVFEKRKRAGCAN